MENSASRAIAIVGLGCILPDAPTVDAFWQNIMNKRYSIADVPPERWPISDYYDPDITTPDKTYSTIGGWVRDFQFDWKQYRIPPKVAASMDIGQQWSVTIAADALADYGYPNRPLDTDRTAVILGTAMGGELHYLTHLRLAFPEYARALRATDEFQSLPAPTREAMLERWHSIMAETLPPVTEDTMPGELPNIVSGRVANLLNLHGPNFITDAACAASFAAINAAIELLTEHQVDAVITGGVDRNMGVSTFIKFCKIGALSATGSRPFGEGADGFVMGEGAAAFLLKRLEDAERAGDKIYAVIRGVGGASDGRGKGITAPNPVGQQFAMRRAWENAGLDPATADLVEAHGTSTRVGDVVEVESLTKIYGGTGSRKIGLGSVKSNIGHLKAGAGAAGLLKATLALHHRVMPPTLNAQRPNPDIDFNKTPFYVVHDAQEWHSTNGTPRRMGVSAYGFGGTNFHLVMEEHVPGLLTRDTKVYTGANVLPTTSPAPAPQPPAQAETAFRGIFALGAANAVQLKEKLDAAVARVETGWMPPIAKPAAADIRAQERLVVDFGDHDELLHRLHLAQKAMGFDSLQAWKPLQSQGVFRGSGERPGKMAFLFPGQGSQYINMGRALLALSPVVAQVFAEADAVMTPILGQPLTAYLFADDNLAEAEVTLMQTAITQPAMLTLDIALYRLLEAWGFQPDMVMGHSLGEYAALIVSGIMPFADALEAAAARGSEMTKVSVADNGWMAAVLAPYEVVIDTLKKVDGYVVPANINSKTQSVIGGESKAVERAIALFTQLDYKAIQLPVSHAFHTRIVAPASAPLRQLLNRLRISAPRLPLISNVTGEFYPSDTEAIKDLLELQIASPVQWVKGLETLYASGVRTFVEVGPKRALKGFVDDVFADKTDVISLLTNHPKTGEVAAFNQALCGLYAAGYAQAESKPISLNPAPQAVAAASAGLPAVPAPSPVSNEAPMTNTSSRSSEDLVQVLAQALQSITAPSTQVYDRSNPPRGSVVITGTGMGLPGAEKAIMDPTNVERILRGEQFIDLIPERFRKRILKKRITRLVKSEDGDNRFETISDADEVIKLAGRPGYFDLEAEYGVPGKLIEALDTTTQLSIAAGLDALREAGIPLVQTYRATSTGKHLPDRWMLPEALRDGTGVVFASAFPGGDRFADEFLRYYTYQNQMDQLALLEDLRRSTMDPQTLGEIQRRITDIRDQLQRETYEFDRRFIFRILAMGHSQFAEYIGARGPNTHVNAACASTTQGIGVAEDWIRNGRCQRVIVLGADNVTSERLMEWIGAGFLATGAAATDDRVEEAALPFDRRRHGTIIGMGACALVIESEDAVRERGMRGIVEVLSTEMRNSAFHGTRLDVNHISDVMNALVTTAERRFGLNRHVMAPQTVFMSHETFTPARGGSASAEVAALRRTFGDSAKEVIIANTKGFTGHPMGVGVEDVIALKILEKGIVPPVPNFQEVDHDLGVLNLSRGGRYAVRYALHLSAGFGSQIAMSLTRHIPGSPERIDHPTQYQKWLDDVSGYDNTETEVEKRVLRIKAQGAPLRRPLPSRWQYGTEPTLRTIIGDTGVSATPAVVPPAYVPPPVPQPIPAPASTRHPEPTAAPVTSTPVERRVLSTSPSPVPLPETPAQPVQPPVAPQAAVDTVLSQVLQIVAQQTGYPIDMLEPDLDMEADLGIDTVKQAETFAAIRKAFDIPRRDDLKLRDYPTLARVVEFVREMRPDLKATVPPVTAPAIPAAAPTMPTAAPAMPVASAVAAPAGDPVLSQVLQIVAQQTGYPIDMLEPDLDMEADLGIDTVKQAETFAAIRKAFDIPRRDDLKLRDYPTLARVVEFVREMRPDLKATVPPVTAPAIPAAAPAMPAASAVAAPAGDPVLDTVLHIVAQQTGYPIDMLEPDLDMEADLGIDTVKQAETFAAIRKAFDIPRRDDLKLRDYPTLARVVEFVREMRPDLKATVPPVTAPAMPAAAPAMPAASAAAPAGDPVLDTVLHIVAQQTGYPVDMLEPDLDMEADLGIDTVKQAETFAAIRKAFDIPRRDDLKLRDYPTLARVVEFVREMRPDLMTAVAPALLETAAPAEARRVTVGSIDTANTYPRRVALPSPRPALEFCKPTGVALDDSARVFVMPDRGGIAKALINRLEKRGVTVLTVEDPNISTDALEAQLRDWGSNITGVYWLPALDVEPDVENLDLETWRELNRQRVINLYSTMRMLYESVNRTGTFLVSATRMGGWLGMDAATAPLGGGVSGFTKAFKRECPDALVKVVDFETSRKTAEPADALIAETLRDPGAVEIGLRESQRFTVTLVEQPVGEPFTGMTLDQNTVFLVTGAAGGITSAIISDLAAASGGVFYLLDLTPTPAIHDPYIALLRQDRETLKERLIADARAASEKLTPAQLEKRVASIERQEAALTAIEAVMAAGGTAYYYSVDLRDGAAINAVIDELRAQHGRIDVLIHAGGLEISRRLPDKDLDQFSLVFGVKADGFFNLLNAARGLPIGAAVAFSSVAGRFGNSGQTDYSAANDLLAKMCSSLRRWRPETRGIVIDWTAWGGIGMATRGSIPKIMEMAGIEMLPPEVGIPTVRRELIASPFHGEIVVGGRLGILGDDHDETGGADTDTLTRYAAERGLFMAERVTGVSVYQGMQVETRLDPTVQPFLYDHALEGTPLLPGVMGTETFAQVASLYGDDLIAVNHIRFDNPFKFYRNEPQTLYVNAVAIPADGADGGQAVQTVLRSRRTLANGDIQEKIHFTAEVRLGGARPADQVRAFTPPSAFPISAERIYQVYFHGPAYQVLEAVAVEGSRAVGLMAQALPADTSPDGQHTLMAPRLIELCFQTAGLWEIQTNGVLALPLAVDSVCLYHQPNPQERLYAVVEATQTSEGVRFDAEVVDAQGQLYLSVVGYRTVKMDEGVRLS